MPLKTISGYAPVGAMDRQVDIWDQPLNLLPVLFAEGVWASILTVPTTSLSPVSANLGQTEVWPRILGHDVSMIPHMVTIPYLPGVLSRMFLVYNDPDNGPRRFDIDRVIDPDEHKMELSILAIERKDGSDVFDALLNTTADILTRDTSAGDKRGISSPAYTTVATGILCRVAEGKEVPRGKEELAKAKVAIAYREVFMRPWFLDPSPDGSYIPNWVSSGVTYNTKPLTHNHWMLIPSATVKNSNNQATPGEYYDIFDIDNPGQANHHIEVWSRLVQT
jgi:hypothetical protein